jgi:mono/diheme cytochrome c family protein
MKKLNGLLIALTITAACAFAADAKAGKAAYDRACKSCHGADGAANPAIAKAMKVEMRDLGSKEVQAHSDAELNAIITDGKGKMKPTKTVTGADVDNVVAFMRTLKK